jgi:hypothetical protein
MPLQGIFNADFTAFTAACAAAETSLKGFETGAVKTETALNRMADSVSGKTIVQQAMLATKAVEDIGGAAVLTEKELARMSSVAAEGVEKLQKMGQTVPEDMRKLATASKEATAQTSDWSQAVSVLEGTFGALSLQSVIDQAIAFGKQIFNAASELENLKGRTDLGVESLQRFKAMGDESGVSVESIAGALTTLQRNIGQGKSATVGALSDLGISLDAIKRMTPEEKLREMVRALKEVDDQDRMVALGSAAMGRSFIDILPLVRAGIDDTKSSMHVWGETTTAALDGGGNAVKRFGSAFVTELGERVADLMTGVTRDVRALEDVLANMPKAVKAAEAAAAFDNFWGHVLPPSVPKDLDDITAKSDAWGKKNKEMADAMAELSTVGRTYRETIAGIQPDLVAQTEEFLRAGQAQALIAKGLDLTQGQVKAVADRMKDYADTIKAVQKLETDRIKEREVNEFGLSKAENDASQLRITNAGKAADQLIAIDKQLNDTYMQQSMDRYTYENLKLWEAAETQIAAFKKTGATAEQVTAFSNKVYEATAIKVSEMSTGIVKAAETGAAALTSIWAAFDRDLSAAHGTSLQVAQAAEQAFENATRQAINVAYSDIDEITQTGIDAMNRLLAEQQRVMDLAAKAAQDAKAKADAANTYQGGTKLGGSTTETAFGQNYLIGPNGSRVPLGPHGELPDNWFDVYSGKSSFSSVISNLPRFASGVENFAGGLALVGERGPELVNLPGGSDVIPRGGFGGGVTNNVVIHVNGTAAEVAQKVAAELMRTLRSGQQLPLR